MAYPKFAIVVTYPDYGNLICVADSYASAYQYLIDRQIITEDGRCCYCDIPALSPENRQGRSLLGACLGIKEPNETFVDLLRFQEASEIIRY